MGWVGLAVVAVFVARCTSSGLRGRWELRARRGRAVIRHCRKVRIGKKFESKLWKDERFVKLKLQSNFVDFAECADRDREIRDYTENEAAELCNVALIIAILCDSNDKKSEEIRNSIEDVRNGSKTGECRPRGNIANTRP